MEKLKSDKKRMVKCSLCIKIVDEKKLKPVVVPLRKWMLCDKCYKEFNS